MRSFATLFFILGFFFLLLGALFSLGGRLRWLGRLPGDIIIKKENFTFIFPLTTCILLSLALSLILWLALRLLGRGH